MLQSHDALVITDIDRKTALRLLSALVLGWGTMPAAIRGRLIQDSCLIDGDGSTLSFPATVLAFVEKHKDRPLSW